MMQDFNDRVAFVTGAASGIGLGMTRAFVRAGMQVMMADIESKALAAAAEEIRVNTSSIAGVLGGMPAWGPHNSTKHAVVGLTEVLRQEGRAGGFVASVLCPGGVNTNIFEAPGNRPSRFGPQESVVADQMTAGDIRKGLKPDIVGSLVLEAIKADRQFIFTDPGLRSRVERRHKKMMADFEWAAHSNALVTAGAPGAIASD